MNEEYLEVLKRVSIFRDLDDDQLGSVADHCHEFKVLAGERVFTEGERGSGLFVLMEGDVEISKRLTLLKRGETDYRDKKLNVLRADSEGGVYPIFGEMGLFESDERSATVTAISTSMLLDIRSEDWLRICEADYKLGYYVTRRLMEIVSGRLRNMNRDILKLTTALCMALD